MDKKLALMSLVFGVMTLIIMAFFVMRGPLARYTQATSVTVSLSNSLIFAYPLTLKADGKDSSKVDVFLVSTEDKPVKNYTVMLNTGDARAVPSTMVTDDMGKATFQLDSKVPGPVELSFSVDGVLYPNKVTVMFEE